MNNMSVLGGGQQKTSFYNSVNSAGSNKSASFSREQKINNATASLRKGVKKPNNKVEVTTYTDKEGRVHKTYTGKGTDVVETMRESAKVSKNDKVKPKKRLNYSYQKLSNQVLMAKTSMSASKAVLSARRSLSELKRKLKSSDCSEDEKQAALTHASRMLRIANKKKKNLEMEELIQHTLEADERNGRTNDGGEDTSVTRGFDESNKNEEPQDILEKLKGDLEDTDEGAEEEIALEDLEMDMMEEFDPEIVEELNALLEDFSDETLNEMSEELRDMMDLMEVINPHMDEEHFEKLKTKHRCDEQKALVKADMDYLKEYIRIVHEEAGAVPTCNAAVDMSYADMDMSLGFSVNA